MVVISTSLGFTNIWLAFPLAEEAIRTVEILCVILIGSGYNEQGILSMGRDSFGSQSVSVLSIHAPSAQGFHHDEDYLRGRGCMWPPYTFRGLA